MTASIPTRIPAAGTSVAAPAATVLALATLVAAVLVAASVLPVAGSSHGSFEADPSRLSFGTGEWRTDFTRASIDLAELQSGGPPKDGIPPIDAPVTESIGSARAWLGDSAPLIALEVGGQARAYPLAIMTWHEIVNDTLGGEPVVVTFCPLCNTALVFDRTLDGVVHDFGTTGKLRFSDLVMYDRQTETWWQQATGHAIVGELTGARLRFLPAQITSLDAFARTWPDGDVLSRETGHDRSYGRNPYPGYDQVGDRPFLFEGVIDGRIAPKERVVAVGEGADAIAFAWSDLVDAGVASAEIAGEPIVVFWEPGTTSALDEALIDESADIGSTGVFRPVLDGRELTFERAGGPDGVIRDGETGSEWSVTGIAVAGELAGRQLEAVVHGNHFWFAWAAFTPETRIWQP
jgi:hypothetical protein